MELFELYYTFKRELISIDIMILLYFRPSLRSDLYKTQEDIYIMFIAPEIKLMITSNRVRIFDYDYNTEIEEIEYSDSRGYLYTKHCQNTGKYIFLFFKKEAIVTVLIISRRNPVIRKTFIMDDENLFIANESEFVILEKSRRYQRNLNRKVLFKHIKIIDDYEFLVCNPKSLECSLMIDRLLDMNGENLLVSKYTENRCQNYLSILRFKDQATIETIFTMSYSHPCISRLYKHYIITMTLQDGWLTIRDTSIFNEENPIYSQKFENAIAETLIVKYGKIIFCERNQVVILFLKTIEAEHSRTGMILNQNFKPRFNFDVISRIIELDSRGFVQKVRLTPDAIWVNLCDGIIRERLILKFW